MKRVGFILISLHLIVCFAIPAFADEECSQSLGEAKALYNAGKYQAAKDMFEYVQKLCGNTYGSANTWIQKCDQAIQSPSHAKQQSSAATLAVSKTQVTAPVSGGSEYISVSSNRSWRITNTPASWCTVTKSNTGLTITTIANDTEANRYTSVQIATSDGQKKTTVYISQEIPQQSNSASYLTLSKATIEAPSYGVTEYISVYTNCTWDIQYASGTMYTVTKAGENSIRVSILSNPNTSSRTDYFNIISTDGSNKVIKVTMTQNASSGGYNSSANSSSYNTPSSRSRSSGGYRALQEFNNSIGNWEVEWLSLRGNLCTGVGFEWSVLAFRYSMLKVEPGIMGIRYDFIQDYAGFYYQPEIKLVCPWSSEWATEFGIGPAVNVSFRDEYRYTEELYYDYYWDEWRYRRESYKIEKFPEVWFAIELGVTYHWSSFLSSNFFARYDGMFVLGASINLYSGF